MSYPKLYRDFLENEGAGPLLRADRMPVIETAGIADGAVTEAKLSQSYLPTTGGTITGSFKINDGTDTFTQLTRTPDNGVFLENVKDGKVLNRFVLRNPDRATRGGYFELDANDGTNKSTLTGTPSGALSWNAKPVITLVDSWHSGSSWYRKYSDGWVEQGGAVIINLSNSAADIPITYHIAFSDNPKVITVQPLEVNGIALVACRTLSGTGCRITYTGSGANSVYSAVWYACGS